MVPNCALLMAEHYFDLFQFAYSKNPNQKDFWIFDFLQYNEIESSKQGIEVAHSLFTWPKGVNISIVNCNYSDNNPEPIRLLGPYEF